MSAPRPDRDKHQFRGEPPQPVERPEDHLDWIGPPSPHDVALECDMAQLLARIQTCESELRRHAMWRVYAAKVRMRSDAEIRRQAIGLLTKGGA